MNAKKVVLVLVLVLRLEHELELELEQEASSPCLKSLDFAAKGCCTHVRLRD